MTSFDPDSLADDRAEFDRTAQEFASAVDKVRPATGYDRTGTVTVDIDAQGVVTGVSTAAAWSRHLDADTLGGAVQEALTAAREQQTEQWATAFGDASRGPRTAARPMPAESDSFSERLEAAMAGQDGVSDTAQVEAIADFLRSANEAIDALSAQLDTMVAATHEGRSRHVTVVVDGTTNIVGVRPDLAWLEGAHPTNVGREITEAVQAAFVELARHGVAQAAAEGPLGLAQQYQQDPELMVRDLGLGRARQRDRRTT